MKTVLSVAARDDLVTIGEYIALRNPSRAATFIDELLIACERIGDQPAAWPLLPRHENAGLRRRSFHDYLIIYRVLGDRVEVARVLHGARDFERLIAAGPL